MHVAICQRREATLSTRVGHRHLLTAVIPVVFSGARSCTSRCSSSRSGSTRCCRSESRRPEDPAAGSRSSTRALEFLVETTQAHVVVDDGCALADVSGCSVADPGGGVAHLRVGEARLLDSRDGLGLLGGLVAADQVSVRAAITAEVPSVRAVFMMLPSLRRSVRSVKGRMPRPAPNRVPLLSSHSIPLISCGRVPDWCRGRLRRTRAGRGGPSR